MNGLRRVSLLTDSNPRDPPVLAASRGSLGAGRMGPVASPETSENESGPRAVEGGALGRTSATSVGITWPVVLPA